MSKQAELLRDYADAVDADRGHTSGLTYELRDAADELERQAEELSRLRASQWQPIETATQSDEAPPILAYGNGWWNVAEYMTGLGWWNGDVRIFPTHWQPLPEPPK